MGAPAASTPTTGVEDPAAEKEKEETKEADAESDVSMVDIFGDDEY